MQTQQSQGTQSTDEVIASSGISFHLWRLNQHFWLICLLFPIVWLMQTPLIPVRLFLAVAALLFFATSYTWLMWPHPAGGRARKRLRSHTSHTRPICPSLILFAILIALTLALSLLYGLAFLWLFIGVSAIAGVTIPMRRAFVAIVIFTLLPLGISVGTTGSLARVDWLQIVPLMLLVRGLGVDMIGVTRLSGAIRELHTAREELARLKVEEERLRMARDLHDLLGHTLSLIALKSKLAGRLLEKEPTRATCATRAAQEIREVEQVAHQSLREVREAVAGYRQPALISELDGARQLLEAAGIACSLDYTTLSLPPVTDTVLAWTVREGVTNVIRHSRAQHCVIRLLREHNTVRAEVINDGDLRERSENIPARKGLGLSGLTERVTALGGRIEAGPLPISGKAGFRLWVELPIHSPGFHP